MRFMNFSCFCQSHFQCSFVIGFVAAVGNVNQINELLLLLLLLLFAYYFCCHQPHRVNITEGQTNVNKIYAYTYKVRRIWEDLWRHWRIKYTFGAGTGQSAQAVTMMMTFDLVTVIVGTVFQQDRRRLETLQTKRVYVTDAIHHWKISRGESRIIIFS